jgi:predicted secreted Zn-dependent protease
MRTPRPITIVAVALLAACKSALTPAPSDGRITEMLKFNPMVTELPTITTYSVHGRTYAELRQSLVEEAVPSQSRPGARAVGLHYNVSYKTKPIQTPTRCTAEVRFTVMSTTTLPKWEEEAQGDSTLRAAWQDYMTRLRAHESGHRVLAVKYVDQMHRRMEMVERATCADAYQDVRNIFDDLWARLRAEQQTYDADPANRVGPIRRPGAPPPSSP